jgi:hypothetical protein
MGGCLRCQETDLVRDGMHWPILEDEKSNVTRSSHDGDGINLTILCSFPQVRDHVLNSYRIVRGLSVKASLYPCLSSPLHASESHSGRKTHR